MISKLKQTKIYFSYKKTACDQAVFLICWWTTYFLFLAFAFTAGFVFTAGFGCTTILIFSFPINRFRRYAKTTPIRYQIAKVMMMSKIPFHRVACVNTYTDSRKCNPNIRSRNFCIPVGVIAITTAHTRCMNERKKPKTNPVLNLLSIGYYGKKIKKPYFFIGFKIANTPILWYHHYI